MVKNNAVVATKPKRNNRSDRPNVRIASLIVVLGSLAISTGAKGQTVYLGAAQDFTVVSAAGVTNSGSSVITGNVALSPDTSITGFGVGEGIVTGTVHYDDPLAVKAQADALAAYTTLEGLKPAVDKSGLGLGGMTLTPGVYYFGASADLTGTLILDTQGDPNALFVFQIESTLITAANSSVVVTGAGGGNDPNVYWQVGSSATLGTDTTFDGNIFALDSVTLGTGADVANGRTIALTASVTLLSNNISLIPEPATWAMLFSGMGMLGFCNWRRMRRHSNA